jgi:kynurenine formamidase
LNGAIKPNSLEQSGRLGTKATAYGSFILDRVTQDLADLLLHRAAVASGATLQLALDRIFQVANDHLSHAEPLAFMMAIGSYRFKALNEVLRREASETRPVSNETAIVYGDAGQTGRGPMDIRMGKTAIAEATEKLKNWGRWGKDDQVGTLNHVTPEDIVHAASLIRTGKVFALGIPLDRNGPQTGLFGGRFNPIHQMLATGTDAIAGRQDWNRIRYADDTLNLCVQGATHWDALGHIFYEDKAYNGYDAKLIDANGLNVLGIEHSKNKMVGRGVLLDIARYRGVDWLKDGEGISNDELDKCAKNQNVEIRRGDFVIIRTGQLERCLQEKHWGGYAGGDAPGVKFENCYWCQDKQIAAICSDTWGVEVRPNETKDANQPWHWVVIPAMGLCMGEIFYLKELAEDCDQDGIYEFFFCGPPLIITGGTGSPINPQAIK